VARECNRGIFDWGSRAKNHPRNLKPQNLVELIPQNERERYIFEMPSASEKQVRHPPTTPRRGPTPAGIPHKRKKNRKKRARVRATRGSHAPCVYCGAWYSGRWMRASAGQRACATCGARVSRATAHGALTAVLPSGVAGNGLFALADFVADDVLCLYSGDPAGAPAPPVSPGESLAFACSVGKIGENAGAAACRWTPGHQGAFANAPRKTGRRSNATFAARGGRIVLVATLRIRSGDEILAGYGSGYWANIRKRV